MKKRKKSQGKEKKNPKYTIQVNEGGWRRGQQTTTLFFPDINQSSKTYCQEQLKANSPHVQPG